MKQHTGVLIIKNNKRPSQQDKNNEIKILGYWISHQQNIYKSKKYIMQDENIYNLWTEFINFNSLRHERNRILKGI